jgi:hypothetical protein
LHRRDSDSSEIARQLESYAWKLVTA